MNVNDAFPSKPKMNTPEFEPQEQAIEVTDFTRVLPC